MKKHLKRIMFILLGVFVVLFIALNIYAMNPYEPLEEMYDAIDSLDTTALTVTRSSRAIEIDVESPKKHILFMPGGLVRPESYEYLAFHLALEGYDVTIFKPLYHLAILTPNMARRYIDPSTETIVIGHSLGGVVGSMISAKEPSVTTLILLGSYPIKDVTDKSVYIITAEHDIMMDEEAFNNALENTNDDAFVEDITGGNHAQFGWYGPQKGDGVADIDTLTQQNLVIQMILDYLESLEESL